MQNMTIYSKHIIITHKKACFDSQSKKSEQQFHLICYCQLLIIRKIKCSKYISTLSSFNKLVSRAHEKAKVFVFNWWSLRKWRWSEMCLRAPVPFHLVLPHFLVSVPSRFPFTPNWMSVRVKAESLMVMV